MRTCGGQADLHIKTVAVAEVGCINRECIRLSGIEGSTVVAASRIENNGCSQTQNGSLGRDSKTRIPTVGFCLAMKRKRDAVLVGNAVVQVHGEPIFNSRLLSGRHISIIFDGVGDGHERIDGRKRNGQVIGVTQSYISNSYRQHNGFVIIGLLIVVTRFVIDLNITEYHVCTFSGDKLYAKAGWQTISSHHKQRGRAGLGNVFIKDNSRRTRCVGDSCPT